MGTKEITIVAALLLAGVGLGATVFGLGGTWRVGILSFAAGVLVTLSLLLFYGLQKGYGDDG